MAGAAHPLAPPHPDPADPSGTKMRGAGPSRRHLAPVRLDPYPDLVLVAPCGLDLPAARRETNLLFSSQDWFRELFVPATAGGSEEGGVVPPPPRAAVVDGNAMFNRPGPRLVDCLEWLVSWIWNEDWPADLHPAAAATAAAFPWETWTPPTSPLVQPALK
ncbi:hypothetical protein HK405_009732 [Cladochytrium tenue]|nr:hypothetical protein HK405_009732 [Cladochytrium tenue]